MFCYMLSAAQAILRQQALLESTGQATLGPAPVVEDAGLQDSLRASTESKDLEAEDDVSVDDDEPTVTSMGNKHGDEMDRVEKVSDDPGEREAAGSEDDPPRPGEPQEETEDEPNNCDAQSNKWRGAEKDLKFSIEKILSPAFGNDFWAQFPFYRPEMDFLQLQSLAGNLQRLQQLHAEQAKLTAANAASSAQGTAAHASHAAVAAAAAAAAGHGGHLQAMQSLATLQNCLKASMQQPHATTLNGLNALHQVASRQSAETPPGSALNNLQLSALQSMQQLQSLQLIPGRKSPESRKRRRSSDETSPARTPEVTSPQSGTSTGTSATRIERHDDSESQDTVAEGDSRLKGSDEGAGDEGVGVDKRGMWPAWVYCTRYSDRPSSGPRSKRTKRKEKSDEKRPRTAFTAEQLQRLKKEFQENRYLTEKRRQDLASELGLNESQIKIWFQNKRAKLKKSTGRPNPLALELMAQGLYNHTTAGEEASSSDMPAN